MRTIQATSGGMLLLGRQGDNNATMVRFPVKALLEAYGDLTFRLAVLRSGDTIPYSVMIETEEGENYADWTVSAYDTAMKGVGRCELQCFDEGGTVVKSNVWVTRVNESLTDASIIKKSGGGDTDVATDAEVAEALEDLASRHKT